ncbi:MAG: choice-of-anchor D domain-containing protein, partial [Myxococcota bacterium]|nr:choice-of-anchor D domain-containing protein [Myxococcota bacterium]
MTRIRSILLPLLLGLSLVDCNCSDTLGSAVGQIDLQLCDRGDACGCNELAGEDATIDFGTPTDGSTTRRILRIENFNRPMPVTLRSLSLDDPSGLFTLVSLKRYASYDDDAAVESLDVTGEGYILQDEQYLELAIDFGSGQASEVNATLTISSSSKSYAAWPIALRGGAGSSQTCLASGDCGDGSLLDFGIFDESEVGADLSDPSGRPLALGLEPIAITNTGTSEVLVNIELIDDGIPEASADEPTGRAGYFFLGEVGCAVVAPGETLEVPVEYRPSTAGEHYGQVVVAGLGAPVYINLLGKVVGPHICFETEDDSPADSVLTFGQAPSYVTGQNTEETRRIFATNCGYDADLIIDSIDFQASSPADYTSTELPQSGPITLAVGERMEVPVTFSPDLQSAIGSMPSGAVDFVSNDNRYPTAQVTLGGIIGQPERCILAPSESPVDFGWVATDEAGVGDDCDALPISIPGCEELISRTKTITFTNVGQRDCNNIAPAELIEDESSTDMFSYFNPAVLPVPFNLAPGETSAPINLLFKRPPSETPQNHFAKLPYTYDGEYEELILEARGGGSPNCAIDFSPVANPTFFCPDESVAFGNVNIGQMKTIDLQVINTGSEDCTVGAINFGSLTSSAFTYSSPTLPGIIPVNESRIISVNFEPTPPSGNNPFEEIPFLCGTNTLNLTVNSGPDGTLAQESVALS